MIFRPETAKACVFDMFGTLFNVHSSVAACQDAFGQEGQEFSAKWRRRQLEYSWLRALMKRYVPFWQLTRDALDVTLQEFDRAGDFDLRDRLLDAYLQIAPYSDAEPALRELRDRGVRAAVLTNGSRDMTESALKTSGLDQYVCRGHERGRRADVQARPGNVCTGAGSAWPPAERNRVRLHTSLGTLPGRPLPSSRPCG